MGRKLKSPGFKTSAQMRILSKTIDKVGISIRPQLLDGAREGMKTKVKQLRKKGVVVTVNSAMEEVTNNQDFLNLMKKVDISIEDLKNIAEEVIAEFPPVIDETPTPIEKPKEKKPWYRRFI